MSLISRFKSRVALIALAFGGLAAVPTQAAVVLQVESGKLAGAKGVPVGTLGLFDVRFVSGSCFSVFTGCDDASDFAIQSFFDAADAASALRSLVFTDGAPPFLFDSFPGLTVGCTTGSASCGVYTPAASAPFAQTFGTVSGWVVSNNDGLFGARDQTEQFVGTDRFDVLSDKRTWAVWSPASPAQVPEPSSLALLGVAGAALGWTQLRRRRNSVVAQ